MYGRIAPNPLNVDKKNVNKTRNNGVSVFLRFNSFIFMSIVGAGCTHFKFCWVQASHEFDRSMYLLSDSNSKFTLFADTHPRSHCSDFCASSVRFLDSNHNGVSGTWTNPIKFAYVPNGVWNALTKHIAIIVVIGTIKHTRATWRQSISVFNK